MPGMLYAAIDIAPVYGGKLVSVDSAPAETMPGVKRVVKLEEAVAVVADSYWRAHKALAALKPQFDDAGHGDVSSASIFAAFDKALGARSGDAEGRGARSSPPTIACRFSRTRRWSRWRARRVWTATMPRSGPACRIRSTRAPRRPRPSTSTSNRSAHQSPLGGGFGRRLPFTYDYVDLGARIAKAMSPTPVKLVWSRENDIQHDYYRPAGMARFAGALDTSGTPLAARRTTPAAATANRCSCRTPSPTRAPTATMHRIRSGPAPWRSVLNSQHGFFKESFVDEIAHAAGKDPVSASATIC